MADELTTVVLSDKPTRCRGCKHFFYEYEIELDDFYSSHYTVGYCKNMPSDNPKGKYIDTVWTAIYIPEWCPGFESSEEMKRFEEEF
ncbi:MAG: hypothetical protein FWB72_04610 [Firmicutes bacterium]|nr:hypothetical protein [Bacillota bacterium]